MHSAITLGATLLAAVASATPGQFSTTGDHCTDIKQEFGGWTGKSTGAVSFTNFPGSYDYTTQGYDGSGACSSKKMSAAGPIAPLSDEMTYVFRGPMKLVNFAMYQPGSGSKAKRHAHPHGHSHQRFHEAKREAAPAYGDKITAKINGVDTVMTDTWSPKGGAPAAGGNKAAGGSYGGASDKAAAAKDIGSAPAAKVAPGQWARTAHYASNGKGGKAESDGLAFLMAMKYTDSVAFFSAAGGKMQYAAEHTVLPADTLIPDNEEFYIASGEACSDSNPCEMKGSNVTGYHGFKGDRMAVFEFAMPQSGNRNCDTYNMPNPDMPCIWALATHVVNNLQYGSCNGWKQGAGEHDIVEVLSPGSKNMFASMHMGSAYAGTACDAFERPTAGTMKMAVIYSGSTVRQQVLKDFDFGSTVDASDVQACASGAGSKKMVAHGSGTSMMKLNHNIQV